MDSDINQRLWEAILKQIRIKRNEEAGELHTYLGNCLRMATNNNNLDLVKRLIEEENADPNHGDTEGMNSIMIAAENGHVSVLEYFISLPDKVNINAQDRKGTALHYACFQGFEEAVRILISSPQLDVNIGDKNGITPLMLACKSGHEAVVSMLLVHDQIRVDKADAYMYNVHAFDVCLPRGAPWGGEAPANEE